MHTRTSNEGFSLIETLVVCVIVAILAAVGIPMYSGYVTNQRYQTVNNLAETAAASANAYLRRTGSVVTAGKVSPNTAPLYLYFNASKFNVTAQSDTSIKVTDSTKTSITSTAFYK
jgi:prepilin-type N-terminal cleavage/methylation domain-containing protein